VRRVKHIAISVRSRVLYIESRFIMHPAAYDSNDAEKVSFGEFERDRTLTELAVISWWVLLAMVVCAQVVLLFMWNHEHVLGPREVVKS
jgi:hypothetical protein